MSNRSLDLLNLLHPFIRQDAITCYHQVVEGTPGNVHPVIDSTLRTFPEQTKLYAQGRTMKGKIVSNAKAGQSYHNYGLALDFHLVIDGKDSWTVDKYWMYAVAMFKSAGFTWGGDFKSLKDYPHLENSHGYTVNQLLERYKGMHFIPGTNYVQL